MTEDQAELITKLAMSLDTCLDLVADAARKENRANEGKSMREVTWQKRSNSFSRLIVEARDALSTAGKTVPF